jgi:hypothetical protein
MREFDLHTTPRGRRNVLGERLEKCGLDPVTGWFRDGCCAADEADFGRHVVCAEMTEEFLVFGRDRGNDLMTPRPELGFAGLSPGDRWCVCAARWLEALHEGVAPPVVLAATEESALEIVALADLKAHALDFAS